MKIYLVRQARCPKNFAAISWYDVTKITIVSKLTKTTIADTCIRSCFLLQKKIVKREDWIFAQDGGPSHRGFIRAEE